MCFFFVFQGMGVTIYRRFCFGADLFHELYEQFAHMADVVRMLMRSKTAERGLDSYQR
jgi:hypothetical protein